MNIIDRFFCSPKINLLATMYFNFKVLPFSQAVHMPIFMYGKWTFKILKGQVVLKSSRIHTGMHRFGMDTSGGFFSPNRSCMSIHKNAKFIVYDKIKVAQGTSIAILKNAILEARKDAVISDNVKIICAKQIIIGENTRLAWESQIIDSNFHYTYSGENRTVHRKTFSVILGSNCWFANRVSIMPGAVVPNGCIFASGSLVNKNYVEQGIKENSFLAGSPAKLISGDIHRIYDLNIESKINDYFNHSNSDFVSLNDISIS